MDDEQKGAAEGGAPSAAAEGGARPLPVGEGTEVEPLLASEGPDEAASLDRAALPWTEDLPVALGDEPDTSGPAVGADAEAAGLRAAGAAERPGVGASDGGDGDDGEVFDDAEEFDYGDDLGDLSDDPYGGRRNALPPRIESWRTRSATGAIATAMAMGLREVFQPEKRRPAIIAEAPGDPYADDDPVTVDYAPDDAPGTTVHVKPWLLDKGDPA